MKKAQLEMVGLIVIVMIVGLAMAFALIYIGSQSTEELQHETFGESVISSNFVNSMQKVTIEECKPSRIEYSTLIKDCIANYQGDVQNDGDITCDSEPSCRIANRTAHTILENTLNVWGVSYKFSAGKVGDTPAFTKTNLGCSEEDEKEKPGVSVLTLYPQQGELEMVLEVCKT